MTHKELDKIITSILQDCSDTFTIKNAEYSREDALSNFKKAASVMQTTPERALLGMVTKHIVSVIDLIYDIDSGKVADIALWSEKCGDIRVYMMLLEALAVERINNMKGDTNNESIRHNL